MKYIVRGALAAALVMVGCETLPPDVDTPAAGVEYSMARVYLDGDYIGEAPVELELPAGTYVIVLRANGNDVRTIRAHCLANAIFQMSVHESMVTGCAGSVLLSD